MDLRNNPFYVLELPCSATHSQIYEAVDRLSLWDTKNQVDAAQDALLKPLSRIAAEMDWFCALSMDELAIIRECIAKDLPIQLESEDPLTKLNILLYNTARSVRQLDLACRKALPAEQSDLLCRQIIDISNVYNSVASEKAWNALRACHRAAGIPDPSSAHVANQLKTKCGEIVRFLVSKLELLSDEEYGQVATRLGETLQQSYGKIISDLVDQYELHTFDAVKELEANIYAEIRELKTVDDLKERRLKTDILIQHVESWSARIRPCSLKAFANGMSHSSEKKMGYALISLAVSYWNKKGDVYTSGDLLKRIKPLFERTPSVTDEVDSLTEQIRKIKIDSVNEWNQQLLSQQLRLKKVRSHSSANNGLLTLFMIIIMLLVLFSISQSCTNGNRSDTNYNAGQTYSNPISTIQPYSYYAFEMPTLDPAILNPPTWNPSITMPTLDPNLKLPELVLPDSFDFDLYLDPEP